MMNNKFSVFSWFFLSLTFVSLSLGSPASAQLFQNTDTACEAEGVLCESSSNCTAGPANSIACKNASSTSVDFDDDGFPDCVASIGSASDARVEVSVLINKGGAATDCTTGGGVGDQFSGEDYAFTGITAPYTLASVLAGDVDGDLISDIAFPDLKVADKEVAFVPGVNGSLGGDESTLAGTGTFSWDVGGFLTTTQTGFNPDQVERTAALLDCNGDSALDAALLVLDQTAGSTFSIRLNVLQNSGSGLQAVSAASDSTSVASATDANTTAALAVADFDGDSVQDVVVAVNDSAGSQAFVCLNDGATCAFDCTTVTPVDLSTNASPFSIAAGDFNGDGFNDAVVSEPGLTTPGLQYLFGDGSGALDASSVVTYSATATNGPQVLTTGCLDNDNITDVAVGYDTAGDSVVEIISLNSSSAVKTQTVLSFSTAADTIGGIDSANFDSDGGDDLVALATDETDTLNPVRKAYIFMNQTETASADAGADKTGLTGGLSLSDAGCTVSPSNDGDAFDYSWSVVSSPAGSTTSFSDSSAQNPDFNGDTPGDYVLQVVCTTRCGEITANDTVAVTLTNTTQGGCVASLTPAPVVGGLTSLLALLAPLSFWGVKIRRRKSGRASRVLVALFFLFGGVVFSNSAQALTTSFSTNFFKPATDDSDFFSVYSSPTLTQRHYHFGLWLDYAHHPYEVGNSDFERQSGVTDGLFSGNVLGSYGALDWLDVGGRLPLYFWNGIHAPSIGRPDENHFNLGDLELNAKFRLIDRKKHVVGVSVLPFISVPTATHASRDFAGNGSVSGGAKLIVDSKIHNRVSLALNAGYEARDGIVEFGGNKIDDHFLLGAGVSVDAVKRREKVDAGEYERTVLKLVAEAQLETVVSDFFEKRRTTPAEARVGGKYSFKNGIDVDVGGGLGLSNGISSPDFRALAGVTYTKRPIDLLVLKETQDDLTLGDEIKLVDKIYFDFDKSVIRSISKPVLDRVATLLRAHLELTKVRIEGHTCDLGTDTYNQKLSGRRAQAVVDYLVGQGIAADRLHAVGYGESRPDVPNVDEPHREQNRRVQMFVEEKK